MEQAIEYFRSNFGKPRGSLVIDRPQNRVDEGSQRLEKVNFIVNPDSVAAMLAGVTFLLVLASVTLLSADYLTGNSSALIHKLVKLFDLDLETNVPTFFSVLLLATASFVLAVVTAISKKQKSGRVLEWTILSAGFLFMALDELASIHERMIEPMRALMGIENLGPLYYAWVVPAIFAVLIIGVGFINFLIELPAKTRWSFMIAGAMYLTGAVGFEALEGMFGQGNLAYNVFVTIEESLEMLGVVAFIWALLVYIAEFQVGGRLRFDLALKYQKDSKNWMIRELGITS